VLAFAAALRPGECLYILVGDQAMRFHDDLGVDLHIYRSKGDKTWQGVWVTAAAAPGQAHCPVALLRLLLQRGDYVRSAAQLPPAAWQQLAALKGQAVRPAGAVAPGFDFGPLVRPVRSEKGAQVLRHRYWVMGGKPAGHIDFVESVSYTTFNEHFKRLAARAGFTPEQSKLHCARISGATRAAGGGSAPEDVRGHARWRTPGMERRYDRPDEARQRAVSGTIVGAVP
jgi:hypothetical protein